MPPFHKHPSFIVRREVPFNGGPALPELVSRQVTPVDRFFVRNHGDVPRVDREGFRLVVDGRVTRPLSLSLSDLAGLPRAEVAATLQCAGNRRTELIAVAPLPGELPWGEEAVSHAVWGGVPLAAVLAAAGVEGEGGHAAFLGLDEVEKEGRTIRFGGSVPLDKALSREVLLADTMNGEPLSPVHGAPLRAVVPGFIGARSVKWLARVTVQDEPSDNFFQAKSYRLVPPGVTSAGAADWAAALPLGDFPVNSAICVPSPGSRLPAGRIEIAGYAVAGGGRDLARVDVTADDGATWTGASLGPGDRWSWRLWRAELTLPPGTHTLAVRAWDAAANSQPERVAPLWNFKGYVNNAWHRVTVEVA